MRFCCLFAILLMLQPARSSAQVLDAKLHHLRSGSEMEWDEFADTPEATELVLKFNATKNTTEQSLRLRQRDVKQAWNIRLNDKKLAMLLQDEKDTVLYLKLLQGALRDGENQLKISCDAGPALASDDIIVGDIRLIPAPLSDSLSQSTLNLHVTENDQPIPSRITIVDENNSLISLATPSSDTLAVRPGVIYTANGDAKISLPAGTYTLYAGRGFEYSLDSTRVELKPGDAADHTFKISRVVKTPGYVSCDTHIHTLTYSRHGDATVEERMLTLAGENIELAIATDHNLQIDYTETAKKLGVDKYFTSVIGNEVTTAAQGHFNIFPIPAESKLLNFRAANWDALATNIAEFASPNPVIILNHARDNHGGFRPDDPSRFIPLAGQRTDGRKLPANAMEVINSGAILSDYMLLYRDWFGLLNRGQKLTPVGASDSHDVSRYIVGQGRTYIRCDDSDPSKINIEVAKANLLAGKVLVSYGLLADMTINQKFHPGDLVSSTGPLEIDITVQSPPWSRASRLSLFANGIEIKSMEFPPSAGRKWESHFTLPKPKHDLHLVALATGPGITANYWQCAKPYQPTSTHITPYVLGSTGALFIDADGNEKFDSTYDYAQKILDSGQPLATELKNYDASVAAQLASILQQKDPDHFQETLQPLSTFAGIKNYLVEWQEHLAAASATKAAKD
jgi:hypothetical protein